jgi:hypothetical protein
MMRIVLAGALTSALAFACAACSGGDNSHPQGGSDYTSSQGSKKDAAASFDGDNVEVPCTPFEKRECTIDLGVVNGVHNCTQGVQVCENGEWSECAQLQL